MKRSASGGQPHTTHTRLRALGERLGIAWFIVAAGFVVGTCLVSRTGPSAVDLRITLLVQRAFSGHAVETPVADHSGVDFRSDLAHGDWTTLAWRLVSLPGTGIVGYGITTAVLAGALAVWRGSRTACVLLALVWCVAVTETVVKRSIGRPRPCRLAGQPGFEAIRVLSTPNTSSYPSGHATMYMAAFGFVAWCGWRHARSTAVRLSVVVPAVLLIALVGVSRVYLGAHWASDVVGGWMLGWLWLRAAIAVAPEDVIGRPS